MVLSLSVEAASTWRSRSQKATNIVEASLSTKEGKGKEQHKGSCCCSHSYYIDTSFLVFYTMRSTGRQGSVLVATVLSIALLQLFVLTQHEGVEARSTPVAFFLKTRPSLTAVTRHASSSFAVRDTLLELRGGDDASSAAALEVEIDVDDIESSDEEEDENEEEEEEEPKLDPKLARSTQSAVSKAKARAAKAAASASKAKVASALKSKTEKKSKSGLFHIPYIVKACLNPFVFMQMTKGYWKSLFNYKFADTLKVSSVHLLLVQDITIASQQPTNRRSSLTIIPLLFCRRILRKT